MYVKKKKVAAYVDKKCWGLNANHTIIQASVIHGCIGPFDAVFATD